MRRIFAIATVLTGLGAPQGTSQQPPNQPVIFVNGVPINDRPQQPDRPHPPDDPIARVLFPPELVMQHQQEIALRPEQRAAIEKAIVEFQSKVVGLQWKMQDQSQRLVALLDKPTIDPAPALAQVDEVLGAEREVKRAHMALLIQIKNTLSAEQQARLSAARATEAR
jgi:Spy/CpxP family protein refolding chaperone